METNTPEETSELAHEYQLVVMKAIVAMQEVYGEETVGLALKLVNAIEVASLDKLLTVVQCLHDNRGATDGDPEE